MRIAAASSWAKAREWSSSKSPATAALAILGRRSLLISVALVALASFRIVATYTIFNHTVDEPDHIACGIEWLDKGTYRLETQHPPLARAATAILPYLAGSRAPGRVGPPGFEHEMQAEGLAVLYGGHHYDLTLGLARLGILPFFWVACFVVYLWGKRYFGPAVAAVAVFLFSFLPPVLAHAGSATTDMAVTAFLAFIKTTLGEAVSDVRLSDRLTDSAVCLVAPEHGPDRQLEKLLIGAGRLKTAAKPILEINPRHDIIKALASLSDDDRAFKDDAAHLLFDQARILDGDRPEDARIFGDRLARVLRLGLEKNKADAKVS
jgi:hypothetical protein